MAQGYWVGESQNKLAPQIEVSLKEQIWENSSTLKHRWSELRGQSIRGGRIRSSARELNAGQSSDVQHGQSRRLSSSSSRGDQVLCGLIPLPLLPDKQPHTFQPSPHIAQL
uniref:Uncharacterized protein n=1 Tax=Aegilops tauschii TaxID=37682 RepID=M8BZE6_AEGTA